MDIHCGCYLWQSMSNNSNESVDNNDNHCHHQNRNNNSKDSIYSAVIITHQLSLAVCFPVCCYCPRRPSPVNIAIELSWAPCQKADTGTHLLSYGGQKVEEIEPMSRVFTINTQHPSSLQCLPVHLGCSLCYKKSMFCSITQRKRRWICHLLRHERVLQNSSRGIWSWALMKLLAFLLVCRLRASNVPPISEADKTAQAWHAGIQPRKG